MAGETGSAGIVGGSYGLPDPDWQLQAIAAANLRKVAETNAANSVAPPLPPGTSPYPPQMATAVDIAKFRAQTLSNWANAAPTAPPGAALAATKAGIGPDSAVGQWIIKNAVPAVSNQATDPNAFQHALDAINDPDSQALLKNMSISDATNALSSYQKFMGFTPPSQSGVGTGGTTPIAQVGQAAQRAGTNVETQGIGSVGDALTGAKTAVREVGTVANAGAQTLSLAAKNTFASLAQSTKNVLHGEAPGAHEFVGGTPTGPEQYQTPTVHIPNVADIPGLNDIPGIKNSPYLQGTTIGGSKIDVGGPEQLLDPGQITLVQQARGLSTGTGFFPAGPATQAATLAQRAAATVNGHALTPGRAFASFVTQPDTMAYNLASGLVDMQVALNGDPANLLASELSDTAKGAKLFAPTTDDALDLASHAVVSQSTDLAEVRNWTGAPAETDLVQAVRDKLQAGGSLSDLTSVSPKKIMNAIGSPNVGAFSGLRKYVVPQTGLTYLNSKDGDRLVSNIQNMGFTDLRQYLGKDVPVDYVAQLAKSTDPVEIRQALADGLGTSIRQTPSAGFDFGYDPTARWSQMMPQGSISHLDLNNAIEQSERMLAEAKVPADKWDPILTSIASATNEGTFKNAVVNGMGNAIAQTLKEDSGLSDKRAQGLTKFFMSHGNDDRFWIDEVGNTPYVAGLSLDGEAIPLSGPTLGSELTQSIPVLNGRELKQAASKMSKIYALQDGDNYVAKDSESLLQRGGSRVVQSIDYTASAYTNAFKIGALARLGLPIRIVAEAQARMATAGLDSMFSHPLDYINMVVGHDLGNDITGENFLDKLGDASSTFAAAIGKSSYVNEAGVFDSSAQVAKHWTTIPRGAPGHADWWADKLSTLHMNAVTREAARAIEDPTGYAPEGVEGAGLDAVKEWFSNGAGRAELQKLVDADLRSADGTQWSKNLVNRVNADAYIDNVVVPQILQNTASDPTLLDAVAHGTPFSAQGIGTDLTGQLKEMAAAGQGPARVKALEPVAPGKLRLASNMVDRWFSAIVDAPYRELAKSPTYKQLYWNEAKRLLPFMADDAQDTVIESGRSAGLELTKPATTGTLDLAGAQKLTNIRAITDSKQMLHYVSERNNIADTLRYVAPFGDAWRNVVKSWVHLAAENPQVGRRVQQGVQEMRSSGFFYEQTDPVTGKKTEVFTVVPGALTKWKTGVDFPLTAPVSGLNLASQGLPGVGPAVQLPASLAIPKSNPIGDAIRNKIMPYGAPNFTGGILESLAPGWVDRLRTGGYLAPLWGQTPDDKVTFQDLGKAVFDYDASTGRYNLHDANDLATLSAKAQAQAKQLYLIRSMAQGISPSAPDWLTRVLADDKTKPIADGAYIQSYKLSKSYHDMVTAAKGDTYQATLKFVSTYGPQYIFATEPDNQKLVYGIPTNADAVAYKYAHPEVVRNYPNVYGYFAPQTGPSDYAAYIDAIHSGTIKPLDVQTWAQLADQRLGNAIYSNLRSRVGASPTQADQNWLDQQKAAISQLYPGFGDQSLPAPKKTLDGPGGLVDELRRAVVDPTLKGTDLAHAAQVYLTLRDRALTEARSRTGSAGTTLKGAKMADLRAWLYQNGTAIATKIPDFTNMWNSMFMDEVAPPADASTSGP